MSNLEDQCTLTLTVSQILPRALLKNIIHSITAGDILLWYRDLLDPYQKNEARLLEENALVCLISVYVHAHVPGTIFHDT